jgi:hypothetical protein
LRLSGQPNTALGLTQVAGDVNGLAPLARRAALDLGFTQVAGAVGGLAPLAGLQTLKLMCANL